MFDLISTGKYWDKSWSLVSGCTRCSAGCDHCWALAMEKRFGGREDDFMPGQFHAGEVRTHPERLGIPLRRKKSTVWAIWNDLFHPDVSLDFIHSAFNSMRMRRHIFLILTKRPIKMRSFLESYEDWRKFEWPNVWLGVTVCNQQEADEKIPILLQIPAAVRWVSIEPMLGPISLKNLKFSPGPMGWMSAFEGISWVVLGGETGPGARPMQEEWATSVVNQCKSSGVPVFVKQIHIDDLVEKRWKMRVSKNMDEWPSQLKVRELPNAKFGYAIAYEMLGALSRGF